MRSNLTSPFSLLAVLFASCAPGPFDAAPSIRESHVEVSSPSLEPRTMTGETTKPSTTKPSTTKTGPTRPPLDLRAPKHTETATFALG